MEAAGVRPAGDRSRPPFAAFSGHRGERREYRVSPTGSRC